MGDANVNALLHKLKGMTDKLLVLDEKEVRQRIVAVCLKTGYRNMTG